MTHTFDEIKNAVDNCIIKPHPIKDNLFDIGTRGFYENPFTEIFANIIRKKSFYSHREKFLKSFLQSIENVSSEVIESLLLDLVVEIQHTTIKGNFIDLILSNSKYVLVFENKIEHWLANPLEDYENDIKLRYPNHIPYFYILSYTSINVPQHWKNVVIGNIFTTIKAELPKQLIDKWDFYVQDFLNHYIPFISQLMNINEFEYYSTNFSKIIAANKQVNQFISDVVEKIKTRLPIDTIKRTKVEQNWGDGRGVRLFPCNSVDNITLEFKSTGKFSLRIYYYQDPQVHMTKLSELVGGSIYKNGKEGCITCFWVLSDKEYENVENFISECISQLSKMRQYYG